VQNALSILVCVLSFDHVNLLPFRLNSFSSRSLTQFLKTPIRRVLTFELLLSCALRIRLKSPITNHLSVMVCLKSRNSCVHSSSMCSYQPCIGACAHALARDHEMRTRASLVDRSLASFRVYSEPSQLLALIRSVRTQTAEVAAASEPAGRVRRPAGLIDHWH